MASAALRQELDCSICLDIYTDPVMLTCGHNFCQDCIVRVLDTQVRSGGYSCPECRANFQNRPALQKNITLRNIAEAFQSTHLDGEQMTTGISCTYCIHSPVPAVKSCLLCEASLCDDHLKVHSKTPEHVLCDPTASPENKKCSVHKKILEYYCTADSVCICVSCSLSGEHQGHKVETLDEASKKKKKKLISHLQKLTTNMEKMEKRFQGLQELRRKVQEQAAGDTKSVTALFRDLRRCLEDLEKGILRNISKQEARLSQQLCDRIQKLEIKKTELSRKVEVIAELCNMTDPLPVLQESDTGDWRDTEEDIEGPDPLLRDAGGLDVAGIAHTIHKGLSDMMKGVNVCLNARGAPHIVLDVNTAHNHLQISGDRKCASWSGVNQNRPETQNRFQTYAQVLSTMGFTSGRHYWEVDVSKSEWFMVGMCYPSVGRGGVQSWIGKNNKSWGLYKEFIQCSVYHDCNHIQLADNISSSRVRIYVDYEAGQISFYDVCDAFRLLHTFTTTFTEPLHAALWVKRGELKICGQGQDTAGNEVRG